MPSNYLYAAVALVILAGWFSANPPPPKAPPAPVSTSLQNDPAAIGLNLEQATTNGQCNLEFINKTLLDGTAFPIAKDTPLSLSGWAMDTDKSRLPEHVIVRFKSSKNYDFFAAAQVGLARADVKEHFKVADALSNSGFQMLINSFDLPADVYKLTLVMRFGDTSYICDNGRSIKVQ